MPPSIFTGNFSTRVTIHGDTRYFYEDGVLARVMMGSTSLAEAACCLQAGHHRQTYIYLHWN